MFQLVALLVATMSSLAEGSTHVGGRKLPWGVKHEIFKLSDQKTPKERRAMRLQALKSLSSYKVAHKLKAAASAADHQVDDKYKSHVYLGYGLCRTPNKLDIISAGNDSKAFLNSAKECPFLCESDDRCTGFASEPSSGNCRIYFVEPLQAVQTRHISTDPNHSLTQCYARGAAYSSDWPLSAVMESHFKECRELSDVASKKQFVTHVEAATAASGGLSSMKCAQKCQLYPYFGLKKFKDGRSKCFCMIRYRPNDGLDYFKELLGPVVPNGCPSHECIHTALGGTGCSWGSEISVALYKAPTPHDGDDCPDMHHSLQHDSRFMYIKGELDHLAHVIDDASVTSCSECAKRCYDHGPYVQDHEYGQVCHAYTCTRSRFTREETEATATNVIQKFRCRLFNDPVPHYKQPQLLSPTKVLSSHLCVLRTCIEDTSCAHTNFTRESGFKYTKGSYKSDPSILVKVELTEGIEHCDSVCAVECLKNAACAAYQCSISLNHCYLFQSGVADNPHQVSDISLCVKHPKVECKHTNGLWSTGEVCLCGNDDVCQIGEYCYEGSMGGGTCFTPCPLPDGMEVDSKEYGATVCGADGQEYLSALHARCIGNTTESHKGSCNITKCATDTVITTACLCDNQTCAHNSTCTTNGICEPDQCPDPTGTGNQTVCGNDGVTYESPCHVTPPATPVSTGECPTAPCKDGETDCHCPTAAGDGATTECTTDAGTHCVLKCDAPGVVCGCVKPCTELLDGTRSGDPKCGCHTDDGYINCAKNNTEPGYCHYEPDSTTATCLGQCPQTTPCICGTDTSQACNTNSTVCDAANSKCVEKCQEPGDTNCACQGPGIAPGEVVICTSTTTTSHCLTTIPQYANGTTNAECAKRCTEGAINAGDKCLCGSVGTTNFEVCTGGKECSAEGDAGECIKPCTKNGETDCRCGTEMCINGTEAVSTYCNLELTPSECVANCEEDGHETDCFCPHVEGWLANLVAGSNNTSDGYCDTHTYCDATSTSNGTATCKPGCDPHDGSTSTDAPCQCGEGLDNKCEVGEKCFRNELHKDLTPGDTTAANKPIITSECITANVTNCTHDDGKASVEASCQCGTQMCPTGYYCKASQSICVPDEIEDCTGTCANTVCQCGEATCMVGDHCCSGHETLPDDLGKPHGACVIDTTRCGSGNPPVVTDCTCGKDDVWCPSPSTCSGEYDAKCEAQPTPAVQPTPEVPAVQLNQASRTPENVKTEVADATVEDANMQADTNVPAEPAAINNEAPAEPAEESNA
eukprot:GEMP01001986.1.p1 GENE.GEMP01001986.1~~GEMP01001986.1.p1  ORF type:complete len:1265 (+),score=216.50 GEMP01001986.1:237-4031(+)